MNMPMNPAVRSAICGTYTWDGETACLKGDTIREKVDDKDKG